MGEAPKSKRELALWLKSKTTVSETGCWEWTGGYHGVGYGSISRKLIGGGYAHRAMYAAVIGEIPPKMYVLHHCDNRKCINPEHLFIGTHLDNIRDMQAKGRDRLNKTSPRGKENPSCKFSDKTIADIREAKARGLTLRLICKSFAISETHLLRVLHGKSRQERPAHW